MVAAAPKLLIYKELVSMTPPVNTYVVIAPHAGYLVKQNGLEMAKLTTRSCTATIRFSPDNLAAAEKVAALTGRTVSSLAEYALVLFMRQNYPLAYNPSH